MRTLAQKPKATQQTASATSQARGQVLQYRTLGYLFT